MELPTREVGTDPETRQTLRLTDFSGVDPCNRCDGHPGKDGEIVGGIISFYYIKDEKICKGEVRRVWRSAVAACDCVYGAWRNARQKMQFVDKLDKIPRGLSNEDWRQLGIWCQYGDSYLDAARRMPTEMKQRILGTVAAWEDGRGGDI